MSDGDSALEALANRAHADGADLVKFFRAQGWDPMRASLACSYQAGAILERAIRKKMYDPGQIEMALGMLMSARDVAAESFAEVFPEYSDFLKRAAAGEAAKE